MSLTEDVEVLRNIPLFAKVTPAKLKLLEFTSERLEYPTGEVLFRQGDPGDAAYVILEGEAEIVVDTDHGPVKVATLGKTTSSARSRSCAGCPAPRRWSPMATSRSCACRRKDSSTSSPSFRRSGSR